LKWTFDENREKQKKELGIPMNKTIIKQNFLKQLKLVGLGILMVGASIFVLFLGLEDIMTGRGSPLLDIIFGAFGILFFGLCLAFIIFRLIRPKNILVIDEKGFVNNSTMFSGRFVPWTNVNNIYIKSVLSERFVTVNTKSGKDIDITLNAADITYEEVLNIMQEYLNTYHTK